MNLVGSAVSICYMDNTRSRVLTAAAPETVLNTLRSVLELPARDCPTFFTLSEVQDGGHTLVRVDHVSEITVQPHVLAQMEEADSAPATRP